MVQAMRRALPLLFWWFMAITNAPGAGPTNIVATQGPFGSLEQCEWARQYVAKIRVASSPCWHDGT
jgi:hypothetical protein